MPFRIDLPYVIRPAEIEQDTYFSVPRQITEFLCRTSFDAKYKEGIKDRTIRRVVRNVLRAMSEAVQEKKDQVLLDKHEVTALKEALEAWSVPVQLVDWAEDLLDTIERYAQKEKPKEEPRPEPLAEVAQE